MKFIFFYSPLYAFYHRHIHRNLDPYFVVEDVAIPDLTNAGGIHCFFGGVSIKIELIIQKIKENMGSSIVFSDATILINSANANQLPEFFEKHSSNDLCFADNDGNGYYNIGIILIKCHRNTLLFFKNVLKQLVDTKGWDQEVINRRLENNPYFKVGVFDRSKIYCNWGFDNQYRESHLIFKSFTPHNSNMTITFNNRLDIFKQYNLITEEEYDENYKPV